MIASNYIYIIDAGSTKTDVAIIHNQKVNYKTFEGYNPNVTNDLLIQRLNLLIKPDDRVYFYGSGLNSVINQQKVIKGLKSNQIKVFGDGLAACRATLGHKNGISVILGTGAVVVYYDGQNIIETKGGHGYLIDDFGGGFELGKIIISKWLNNDMNSFSSDLISDYYQLTKTEFICEVYQNKKHDIISKVCKLIPQLVIIEDSFDKLILDYFETFINRHLLKIALKYNISTIHFIGSIAFYFQPYLENALVKYHLNSGGVFQKPIQNLVDFHINQK
jgi:N-acetylglucosamine kinase-like BadF-type ATPase